jgi:succinate dehydrogenase / fumarate reductase flavoprotein subunit
MTRVPGLFACGECGAGLHGANRLGGNSLSDLLVFGRLSGIGAAEYVKKLGSTPKADDDQIKAVFRRATEPLQREGGENPYALHDELADTMQHHVGIMREGKEMQAGLDKLQVFKARAKNVKAHGASQYNPGWHEALSMRAMLLVSEAVTRGALMREESRGGHARLDFEGEREEWQKYNIVIRKAQGGEMQVEKVERPAPPPGLAAIANSKIEDLEAGRVGAEVT